METQQENNLLSTNPVVESALVDLLNSISSNQQYFVSEDKDSSISANMQLFGNFTICSSNSATNYSEGIGHIIAGSGNTVIGESNHMFADNSQCGSRGFRVVDALSTENLVSIDLGEYQFSELSNKLSDAPFSLVCSGAPQVGMAVLSASQVDDTQMVQLSVNIYDNNFSKFAKENVYLILLEHPELGLAINTANSFVVGSDNTALAYNCMVEGWQNLVNGNFGHAEGKQNVASWGAHAEGHMTQAIGTTSHSEGRFSIADNYSSHAENCGTSAFGWASHASGCKSVCLSNHGPAFVWNGDCNGILRYTGNTAAPSSVNPYFSNAYGSFNINPANGISGVFVGQQSLANIIDDNISARIYSNMHNNNSLNDVDDAYGSKKTAFGIQISYDLSSISSSETLSARNDFIFASLQLADDSNFAVVDWGDGTSKQIIAEDAEMLTHTYENKGLYCISITDDVKAIQLGRMDPEAPANLDPKFIASQSLNKLVSIASGAEKLTAMTSTGSAKNMPNIKKVAIANNISTSGYMFHASKLTSVKMDNQTSCSSYMFRQTPLEYVYLPKCTKFSQSLFYQCTNLIAARFDSLTSMAANTVFAGCSSLSVLDISKCQTFTQINTNTLSGIPTESLSVFINKDLSAQYATDVTWSQYNLIPR